MKKIIGIILAIGIIRWVLQEKKENIAKSSNQDNTPFLRTYDPSLYPNIIDSKIDQVKQSKIDPIKQTTELNSNVSVAPTVTAPTSSSTVNVPASGIINTSHAAQITASQNVAALAFTGTKHSKSAFL